MAYAAFSLLSASTHSYAADSDDQTLNTVVVTGNWGSQPRTVADSPSPIDVISAEQLQATGKVGLKEVLSRLLPSFNLPAINGGGTSWSVRGVTMRGLSGDQVLVLVNGKRRHNTALINNLARIGTWSAAYNWNQTKIEKLQDNPQQLSSLGSQYQLFDRRLQKDLTVATPQSKLILASNWKVSDYDVNLAVTRFGSYIEGDNNPVNDRKFSAKWITDLDVAYSLTKHLTLALGANNLFDVYPDKKGIKDWAGAYEYGQFSPFGFGGAYYYTRLAYNF